MSSSFKRRALFNAFSGFIGIALPLSAAVWYVTDSGENFRDRIAPDSAAEAVVQRLPQVAVIGQKEGPAGTTEVFIQVPGVMNMQSVYVLPDGKTVLSGFVLPDMERGGVPGGQLTMPDGKPTVNAADDREGLAQLLTLIRDNPEVREQVVALAEASEDQAQSGGEPRTAADELPSPKPAPAADAGQNSEPKVVQQSDLSAPTSAPRTSSADRSAGAETEAVPSVPQVPAASSSPVPPVADTSVEGVPSPSPAMADSSPDASGQEPADTDSGSDALADLTISDVAGAAAFGNHLKDMLTSDPEIEAIRSITDPQEQQRAYLEHVKDRPAITQGSGPRHLYVLFDANCPVCHKYYQQVKPKVDRGQLTIHWIPAVVFPDNRSSVTAGAQMLALVKGGHQEQALEMLANTMGSRGYTQVLDDHYSDDEHAHALEGVIRGSAAMAMARPETPLIVFETEDGALDMRTGIPSPGYEMDVKVEQEVSSAP